MARYRILIKPSAVREIESIDAKKDSRRIVDRIGRLAGDPRPHGSERLSGQEEYRVRHADFRIVYSIDDMHRIVLVVKVGHRREVYR